MNQIDFNIRSIQCVTEVPENESYLLLSDRGDLYEFHPKTISATKVSDYKEICLLNNSDLCPGFISARSIAESYICSNINALIKL